MPKRPSPADAGPGQDDVPELKDVVAVRAAEPLPPPNLDLFADAGLDVDALRDALITRLREEIDGAMRDLRVTFEEALRVRVEQRLRERLPELIDAALDDAADDARQP